MLSKISQLKVGLLSGIVMTATKLNTRKNKTHCDKIICDKIIEETWWKKKAFQELTEPIKQYVSER